jgi:hypothetical protein
MKTGLNTARGTQSMTNFKDILNPSKTTVHQPVIPRNMSTKDFFKRRRE